MRALGLSFFSLACVVALIVVTPRPAHSQPNALALGQASAGAFEEIGYRYRRYRYGYRPYYRPYYDYGYYQPYYRPYYRPYYAYGYGYPYYGRPYYRPGISLWFGF